MNEKIELAKLTEKVTQVGLFISTVSFEERCKSQLFALNSVTAKRLLFINKDAGERSIAHLEELRSLKIDDTRVVELDIDNPMETADTFQSLREEIESAPAGDIFIDITTFTHEQLLILVHVIAQSEITREFLFGYTGAEQYSTNTTPDGVWLTKGVAQVRTVLGYPGKFLPSRRLHLMILVGFEFERASSLIEQFEPSILTLGIAGSLHSVSSTHYETNQRFFDELVNFVELRKSTFSTVHTFEFSAVDPILTKNAILEHCVQFSTYNTVICPMNTKISTLGAGLAAMENRNLQISYSRAITYNEFGYSTPSSKAAVFKLPIIK